MIRLVAFLYILSQIAYLTLGDSSKEWGGFAYVSLLLTLIAFMKLPSPTKAIDKDFVNFTVGATIARSLYTTLCIYADVTWIYEKTDWFTLAFIACFIAFLLYSAVTHKRF